MHLYLRHNELAQSGHPIVAKDQIHIVSDLHLEMDKSHDNFEIPKSEAPYLALLGNIGSLYPSTRNYIYVSMSVQVSSRLLCPRSARGSWNV